MRIRRIGRLLPADGGGLAVGRTHLFVCLFACLGRLFFTRLIAFRPDSSGAMASIAPITYAVLLCLQMLLSAKVPEVARMAAEAVGAKMCVVIGLQSTGEAATGEVLNVGYSCTSSPWSGPCRVVGHVARSTVVRCAADGEQRRRRRR